ncbi:MAG: hypothetical protein WC911_03485 [Thermoleophilia bacterium]
MKPKYLPLIVIPSVIAFFTFWVIVLAVIGAITGAGKKEEPKTGTVVEATDVQTIATQPEVKTTQAVVQPPPPLTPQENIAQSSKVVLKDRFRSAEVGATGEAIIQFASDEYAWDGDAIKRKVCEDSVKTAKQIYGNEGSINSLIFQPHGTTKDTYGNEHDRQLIVINISRATSDKINPSGVDYDKCPAFVDHYSELVSFE